MGVTRGPPSRVTLSTNSTFLTFAVQADGIFKQLQQIILGKTRRRRRIEALKLLVGFNSLLNHEILVGL